MLILYGAVNSTAEQKTRLLEAKVVENAETIEQLRRERSLLVSDHKDLQKQFSEVTKVSLHPSCSGHIH